MTSMSVDSIWLNQLEFKVGFVFILTMERHDKLLRLVEMFSDLLRSLSERSLESQLLVINQHVIDRRLLIPSSAVELMYQAYFST